MSGSPTSLDIAYSLLEEGRLIDAEQLMLRELQAAEQKYGHGSPEWASAQCDLGNVLFSSRQFDRAVECYRSACSRPPVGDREAYKDHLTYRLNLGTVLTMLGRLDDAEHELRHNLQERHDFYGREHPGYAFCLEPLADVLLRRGDAGQARQVIEEAIGTYGRNRHERIAGALALRAETGLVAALESHVGPDHQTTLNALSHLANIGHDAGDQTGRVEAIQKVLAAYDRQGRHEDALMATLGLAIAQDNAGDPVQALRTYAEAHTRADAIGRHDLRAQVLRNWGLALSAAGHPAEAEQRLREAVAEADLGNDPELLGRSRIALGLFLQHEERLAEAQQMVEAGLPMLDVAHPDAITGRSHLGAIVAGRSGTG
ncbi:tetratricopeptide repeat protein [Nonomuraea sp. SYSU D8015]|uniref:tetratricopeptide repeat protein n=1 Tax=Nonomuraea sp. SYSU D8015 TaxID=2593644 RepID=UPI0016602A17|nr:tetratricopeptide repeat protein [Nonomuraea sp. SYSU D8015]